MRVVVRQTLRNKLVVVFLVPTLLIVLGYGALAYAVARQGLEDELGKRIEAIAQTLSAQLSGGFDAAQLSRLDDSKRRTRENFAARLERARQATGSRRIFIVDQRLNSLVDTQSSVGFGEHLYTVDADRFEVERAMRERRATTSVLFTAEDGTRYKTAYVPVYLDEARTQVVGVLGVAASASFFELLTSFGAAMVLIGLVGLALVVLVGVVFSRHLTRPVQRLVVAAERLGQGDLQTPVDEIPGEDELAFLGRAFEEMRQNILDRDQQMQMMLSGIAHEVRNPLGGMELFCGLLREDMEAEAMFAEDGQAEAVREKIDKLDRVQRELSYLDRVVTDFLEFARHRGVERERFDAAPFAAEIASLLAGPAAEVDCTLAAEVDEGVDLTADRERLRRVVINVIRNAYQACAQRGQAGHIALRVEGCGPDGDTTARTITIRDDGPGIPAAQLEQIRTPFFTTKEKGSGLGLALSDKIIAEHGGRMEIDSAPGSGTTVRFVLPFDATVAHAHMEIPEGWLG